MGSRMEGGHLAPSAFATTRWSLIASARDPSEPVARNALSQLCQTYWCPLYAFARKRGYGAEDAADLVQGFVVEMLDGRLLNRADPAKGRFRSYLLGALKHFMAGDRDRAAAKKRGGGRAPVSLSFAEDRYAADPAHTSTPELSFDRQWALALLDAVLQEVRAEYDRAGKAAIFDRLQGLIAGPLPDRSYAEIAAGLGTSEGAVKVSVHRLRKRYQQVLRERIADTTVTAEEADDELNHLRTVLAAG